MLQSVGFKFSDLELNFISVKRDGLIEENWQENYKYTESQFTKLELQIFSSDNIPVFNVQDIPPQSQGMWNKVVIRGLQIIMEREQRVWVSMARIFHPGQGKVLPHPRIHCVYPSLNKYKLCTYHVFSKPCQLYLQMNFKSSTSCYLNSNHLIQVPSSCTWINGLGPLIGLLVSTVSLPQIRLSG